MYGERFLNRKARLNNDVVAESLVNDNKRLVGWVWSHFIDKNPTILRYEDEIKQIGLIALWEAALAFDFNRVKADGSPVKFSVVATQNIFRRMVSFITRDKNGPGEEFRRNELSLNKEFSFENCVDSFELQDLIPDPNTVSDYGKERDELEVSMFQDFLNSGTLPVAAVVAVNMHIREDYTYQAIADKYKVSRQRIEQLCRLTFNKYRQWREEHLDEYLDKMPKTSIVKAHPVAPPVAPPISVKQYTTVSAAKYLGVTYIQLHTLINTPIAKWDTVNPHAIVTTIRRALVRHKVDMAIVVQRTAARVLYNYSFTDNPICAGKITIYEQTAERLKLVTVAELPETSSEIYKI